MAMRDAPTSDGSGRFPSARTAAVAVAVLVGGPAPRSSMTF